ncbi:MAG: hypothetical protein M3Q80_00300 [bacterium]|nr:hypothetical protein [bacterium]
MEEIIVPMVVIIINTEVMTREDIITPIIISLVVMILGDTILVRHGHIDNSSKHNRHLGN